jgi:hypothetical protein
MKIKVFAFLVISCSAFAGPETLFAERSKGFIPAAWNGVRVEHVFVHPLVVYPELAYSDVKKLRYMNDWFVTVTEFRSFIAEMYERGYMLVSVRDIFELKDGIVVPKSFILPAGKKPLLLSIDDLNYYKTMQTHGIAKKLVLKNGKLLSRIDSPTGEKDIEDSEAMMIVDRFVAEHPDFSYNNARGIVALTGYKGVFGYRTNETMSPGYEKEKANAIAVAQYLKSKGWIFASHGYRHLDEPHQKEVILERDILRWRAEVEPIVGTTPIHIFPFGSFLKEPNPLFALLEKSGFRYFFGVSFSTTWQMMTSSAYGDRIPIDGKYIAGRVSGSRNSQFCSIRKIIDPKRVDFSKETTLAAKGIKKTSVQ